MQLATGCKLLKEYLQSSYMFHFRSAELSKKAKWDHVFYRIKFKGALDQVI